MDDDYTLQQMEAVPGQMISESMTATQVQIMDAGEMGRTLRRMAYEIVERNGSSGLERLALVGIYTRGVEVAQRLGSLIEQAEGVRPAFGVLDISMHRDDLRRRARLTSIQPTRLPVDLDARTVILADDVFFTGRTIRAALDALGEYGRPPRIQLAALVDRGQRELPIQPDYTGRYLPTSSRERVLVRFSPEDPEGDGVWLSKPEAGAT